MNLTPRQIHGAVGSVLTTASENGWVKTKNSARLDASGVKFIMLPPIQSLEEVLRGPSNVQEAEINEHISLRIGRHALRGWSLTAFEISSASYIDMVPAQSFNLEDQPLGVVYTREEKRKMKDAILASPPVPTTTKRVISKLCWDRSGVRTAIRTTRFVSDELPQPDDDIATLVDTFDTYEQDMIVPGVDMVNFSDDDFVALCSGVHHHMRTVTLSPEQKAREWGMRWINGLSR